MARGIRFRLAQPTALILVLFLLLSVIMLTGCGGSDDDVAPAQAIPERRAPEAAQSDAAVPEPKAAEAEKLLELSPYQLVSELKKPNLTNLQRERAWDSYQGKTVTWIGRVDDVESAKTLANRWIGRIGVPELPDDSVGIRIYYHSLSGMKVLEKTEYYLDFHMPDVWVIVPKQHADLAGSLKIGNLIRYTGTLQSKTSSMVFVKATEPIERLGTWRWIKDLGSSLGNPFWGPAIRPMQRDDDTISVIVPSRGNSGWGFQEIQFDMSDGKELSRQWVEADKDSLWQMTRTVARTPAGYAWTMRPIGSSQPGPFLMAGTIEGWPMWSQATTAYDIEPHGDQLAVLAKAKDDNNEYFALGIYVFHSD